MKERILEFLKKENKSSVHFAEEIGVQPSGISHILSGRNKPSLDFILKMLEKYQFLSSDWLLFGKGSMYKEHKIPTLFDYPEPFEQLNPQDSEQIEKTFSQDSVDTSFEKGNIPPLIKEAKVFGVKRIVWFYSDNSFEEFLPRKD